MNRILLIAMLIATAMNMKAERDENFYVYLCLGQSNMFGSAPAEQCDSVADAGFWMMSAVDNPQFGRVMGEWYPATPPLCGVSGGLSPADYFGRVMVDNLPDSISVGVVSVAVPGSRLEIFDEDHCGAYLATQPDWMNGFASKYEGNPYRRLVDMARLAQNRGVIKGILLHQGESNNGEQSWPLRVKLIYERLLHDLGLEASEVPLIAGETLREEFGGKCAAMNEVIVTLPKEIPTSSVASSAGCPGAEDGLHFLASGYRTLGSRYACRMLEHLGIYNPVIRYGADKNVQ